MQVNPGDLLHLQISKTERRAEAGLKLEERNGRIYIRKVTGLVKRRGLPVEAGDELKSLNGTDVEDLGMVTMKGIIKNELRFDFSIRKYDPDDEDDDLEEEESYQEPNKEEYQQDDQEEHHEQYHPEEIQPGRQYILEGTKLKEYGGERVEVIRAGKKKGKWEVEVLSSRAILAVGEKKLMPVEQYENEDEGESEPEYEEDVEEHMLSVDGYIIQPGDTMKLRGIKKQAKRNGTIVEVLKLSTRRKEWKVELPDGARMCVPGCNLRHVK